MNLASKIDRLRGQAVTAQVDPSGSRRRRLQSEPVPQPPGSAHTKKLTDALQADWEDRGLLLCNRSYRLPADGRNAGDLSRLPEVCGLSNPDWVYIDTETTGLSGGTGNLAFMVGAARYRDAGQLELRQYVLGSFAAERRMLTQLFDWVGPDAVLVSYNGKCFDLPLLSTRLQMHHIDIKPGSLRHLDLMYSVRRAYRDHWPDCRLQTAERRLLDIRRKDDLPGAEAPAAWQSWLRRGFASELARVLEHNYQDVVSLALLHRCLVPVYRGSVQSGVDHAAIGKAWREAGQPKLARSVWESAGERLDDKGSLQLAALYRNLGEWSRAEKLWLRLHAGGNASAALALSKFYEHRRRDFCKALDFASQCPPAERELRYARLKEKMGGSLQLPLLRYG
ncbi:MAG: ribonuclease H-like domain-containing protein [Gammaproteobacteria bacterium]|nr:ribonuclease H-like domain-containing protein [Gammaproteobacteria bacterium]